MSNETAGVGSLVLKGYGRCHSSLKARVGVHFFYVPYKITEINSCICLTFLLYTYMAYKKQTGENVYYENLSTYQLHSCTYGYFSFCLTSGNLGILKNKTNYFSVETSFCLFSNMASSGLKKMFILTILYTHKSVSVYICLIKLFFLFLMADVMLYYRLMLLPVLLWKMLNHMVRCY